MWVLLSRRLRRWLFLVLLVPIGGRVLESLSGRVGERNPRAGSAMASAGRRLRNRNRIRGRRGRRLR